MSRTARASTCRVRSAAAVRWGAAVAAVCAARSLGGPQQLCAYWTRHRERRACTAAAAQAAAGWLATPAAHRPSHLPPPTPTHPASEQRTSTGARCRWRGRMSSSLSPWPSSPPPACLASCRRCGCWWRVRAAGWRLSGGVAAHCRGRPGCGACRSWHTHAFTVTHQHPPHPPTHPASLPGGCLGAVNNWANLREISNAISLWLGISPPDLFFFAVRCWKAGDWGLCCAAD